MNDDKPRIIVGLGNPGKSYEKTRHNMGFLVVERLAEKHNLTFKSSWRFKAKIAKGAISGVKVILLLPQTYMNLSGRSVRLCMKYAKAPVKNLLVITDDIAIPFGMIRLREKGSSGGHNGLKNIEDTIATQDYGRIKLGIGNKETERLKDYVLSPFSSEELAKIPALIDRAAILAEVWLLEGMQRAFDVLSIGE